MDINIQFARSMLKDISQELKPYGLKTYKDAYVIKNSHGWFFEIPSLKFGFDIAKRSCSNAYQARCDGWLEYMRQNNLIGTNPNGETLAYNADK